METEERKPLLQRIAEQVAPKHFGPAEYTRAKNGIWVWSPEELKYEHACGVWKTIGLEARGYTSRPRKDIVATGDFIIEHLDGPEAMELLEIRLPGDYLERKGIYRIAHHIGHSGHVLVDPSAYRDEHLTWDTQIGIDSLNSSQPSKFCYKDGAFVGSYQYSGPSCMGGSGTIKAFDIEPSPELIERFEPVITAMEDRIGKKLIERDVKRGNE